MRIDTSSPDFAQMGIRSFQLSWDSAEVTEAGSILIEYLIGNRFPYQYEATSFIDQGFSVENNRNVFRKSYKIVFRRENESVTFGTDFAPQYGLCLPVAVLVEATGITCTP
jgi:hypothetical protein